MKKALQNIALVAGVGGIVVAAYGPSAKARNYSGNVSWASECLFNAPGELVFDGCSREEARETYVYGSYKEEVMIEPGSVALHAEETREIAAVGWGNPDAWCFALQMLNDFRNRLVRATDDASENYVFERAGSCNPANWPAQPWF